MQFTSCNLLLGVSHGCYWFAPSGEISVRSLIGICFWKKPTGFTPFKNTFYSTAKECVTSQNLGLCICFFRLCKILLPTQCPGWLLCLSHWACQWPAGLYKSWVEAVNTFFPIWFCLPVTCRIVQMKVWRPVTAFSFFSRDGAPSWLTPWFQWDAQSLFTSYYTAFL